MAYFLFIDQMTRNRKKKGGMSRNKVEGQQRHVWTHYLWNFRLHYTWIDIGTPNVSFLVALDTGSDMFWVPCDCIECAPLSAAFYNALVCQSRKLHLPFYHSLLCQCVFMKSFIVTPFSFKLSLFSSWFYFVNHWSCEYRGFWG